MNSPYPLGTVDAHYTFVDPAGGTGTDGAPSALSADLGPLFEEHGVARTVLVQPYASAEATTRGMAFAEATPYVAAVIPWVDVAAPDAEAVLDGLAAHPKLRGVCLPARDEADNHWLLGDRVLRGLDAVARRGLSLDLLVAPRQIPSVTELARRLPGLPIAVAHIGSPFIAKSEREPWGVYMLNLAPRRNVCVKLSGLVSLDTQPRWHVAHIRLFVEAVVRLFGYERTMFGSDWPHYTAVATYGQVIETALAAAGPMIDPQRDWLLHAAAERFYRLG